MTLAQMQAALGMEKLPDEFAQLYPLVRSDYLSRAAHLLSDEYICAVIDASGALIPYRQNLLAAAAVLRTQPAAMLLICLLEQWIRSSDKLNMATYAPPSGTGSGFDFLHLFPALPTIADSIAHMERRGVPRDVITATMKEYDASVALCEKMLGRPAFNQGRLGWLHHLIRNRLLIVGNLKFDFFRQRPPRDVRVYSNSSGDLIMLASGVWVHSGGGVLGSAGLEDPDGSFLAEWEETPDSITGYPVENAGISPQKVVLSRQEWHCILPEDAPIVCVHIPYGANLEPSLVEASYARARDIFAKCYPDLHYGAFYTHTWLLSPQLRGILKPDSRILAFQKKYALYPCKSAGRFVFPFVFAVSAPPDDLSTLPEDTSLRRDLKALYLSGGYIHEYCGIFF